MKNSLATLNKARSLAEQGRFPALVSVLSEQSHEVLQDSPTLAMLYGMAQARLGRHDDGEKWVAIALEKASARGDRSIEARAHNVQGAIALEDGRIDDAARFCGGGIIIAKSIGDNITMGLCSNILGIIDSLRGNYANALGSYALAAAAFRQANHRHGLILIHHNQAITFRHRCEIQRALEEAGQAVKRASELEDLALYAQTLCGRGEIRAHTADLRLARWDVETALKEHRKLGDEVGEAEDLRVLAMLESADDNTESAERLLRDVMARAVEHHRPLLAADAGRDLTQLLLKYGRNSDAVDIARTARARYERLGARVEITKLDELLGTTV